MGVIRGGLLVIVSMLFFVTLLIVNSLFVVSISLKYENVQDELVQIVKEVIGKQINLEEIVEGKLSFIQENCKNNPDFVFNQNGFVVDIPCDVVKEGVNAIIEESVQDLAKQIYYKKYDCNFWDCAGESEVPFFLISEKSYTYWTNKLYLALGISVFLFLLIFLFTEKKSNSFIISGSLVILSSLFLIELRNILDFFIDKNLFVFFEVFFTQASLIFWRILTVGIILFVSGIVMKFFGIGSKISEFFSKLQKKETGKKISKKNTKSK